MSADEHSLPTTRHLDKPQEQPVMAKRQTSPLDVVPWVIEFRVVGTASTIQVQVRESMIIGRSDSDRGGDQPDVDLTPHGAYTHGVSRRHSQILAKDDRITIKDLNSTNGTRLNGYVLSPDHEYRLRHGDELMIGQLRLQVLFAVIPTNDAPTGEMEKVKADTEATPDTIPTIGTGQHVLIVEDDADVAAVFRMALEHAGFKITSLNSGGAALTFITTTMPDIVLMDLMLADVSGPDLVRYIRKQDGGAIVPILVVSGATGGFQMNQALEAGANSFMGKPVNVPDLVQTVGSLVAKSKPLITPAALSAAAEPTKPVSAPAERVTAAPESTNLTS